MDGLTAPGSTPPSGTDSGSSAGTSTEPKHPPGADQPSVTITTATKTTSTHRSPIQNLRLGAERIASLPTGTGIQIGGSARPSEARRQRAGPHSVDRDCHAGGAVWCRWWCGRLGQSVGWLGSGNILTGQLRFACSHGAGATFSSTARRGGLGEKTMDSVYGGGRVRGIAGGGLGGGGCGADRAVCGG